MPRNTHTELNSCAVLWIDSSEQKVLPRPALLTFENRANIAHSLNYDETIECWSVDIPFLIRVKLQPK